MDKLRLLYALILIIPITFSAQAFEELCAPTEPMSKEMTLARKLAPKVFLHPKERFFPGSVTDYLNKVELWEDTQPKDNNRGRRLAKVGEVSDYIKKHYPISPLPKYGRGAKDSIAMDVRTLPYENEIADGNKPVKGEVLAPTYVRFERGDEIGGKKNLYITYYFFYPYNGGSFAQKAATYLWNDVKTGAINVTNGCAAKDLCGYEAHQGDFERITLVVWNWEETGKEQLHNMIYEAHGDAHLFEPKTPELKRPTVYSAWHSHATYPEKKYYTVQHNKYFGEISGDHTGKGPVWNTRKQLCHITDKTPFWVAYPGRWGANDFTRPKGADISKLAKLFGEEVHRRRPGPIGPGFGKFWTKNRNAFAQQLPCFAKKGFGKADKNASCVRAVFGGGRDSKDFDFDKRSGSKGLPYEFRVYGVPESEKVEFNISHNKSAKSDTRWYSELKNQSIVDGRKPGHRIYVSGVKYVKGSKPAGLIVGAGVWNGYKVTVRTMETKGSATDDKIYLTVIGEKDSVKLRMDNIGEDDFEGGRTNIYKFSSKNLGPTKAFRLGIKGSDGWRPDSVTVTRLIDGKAQDSMSFKNKKGILLDNKDEIEISPKNGRAIPGVLNTFRVKLKTMKKSGSATDDKIFINVIGRNGSSGKVRLENPGDDFEGGKKSTYEFTTGDIGTIKSFRLSIKGSDGWRPDSTTVYRIINGKTKDKLSFINKKAYLLDNNGEMEIFAGNKVKCRTSKFKKNACTKK